jgi:hypothetical protein
MSKSLGQAAGSQTQTATCIEDDLQVLLPSSCDMVFSRTPWNRSSALIFLTELWFASFFLALLLPSLPRLSSTALFTSSSSCASATHVAGSDKRPAQCGISVETAALLPGPRCDTRVPGSGGVAVHVGAGTRTRSRAPRPTTLLSRSRSFYMASNKRFMSTSSSVLVSASCVMKAMGILLYSVFICVWSKFFT